ncbi:MAG: hypothetical protein JNJ53_12990 [Rhizobiales bacterium]|nr:hypothetical protein [Hyphomicrobiales bacterium]
MKPLMILAVVGIAAVYSVQTSDATSAANCKAMWNKADTNNDGAVVGIETSPYLMAMTDAEMKPVKPGMISNIEFMKACEDGAFRRMTM